MSEWDAFPRADAQPQPRPQTQRQSRRAPTINFADDNDAIIRTVIGEARGESPEGRQAVAAVIRNRARQRGLTPSQVVLERNQFEPWGNAQTASGLMSISPNDPLYREVAEQIAGGNDPTGGASHFYAPRAQAALGRARPSWDNGTGRAIGNHLFFNLDGAGSGSAGGGGPVADAGGWDEFPTAEDVGEEDFAIADAAEEAGAADIPLGSRDNPIDISDRSQVVGARKGDWVRLANGDLTRAAGSAVEGQTNERQAPGIYTRTTNLADAIGAGAMAASEQIPFLDESVAYTTGLINGEGYEAMRERQQALRVLDNEQNRGARVAGGVTGFGTSFLAPGAAFIGRGTGLASRSARAAGVGGGIGTVYGAGAADEGGLENRAMGAAAGGIIGAATGGAAPAAGQVASSVSAPAANWIGRQINQLSGGRLAGRFSPSATAQREIANRMRDEGITQEEFVSSLSRLRDLDVQPSFIDVIQDIRPNGQTARFMRGVGLHSDASSIARAYAQDTAEQIPAIAQNITRGLAPNAPSNVDRLASIESRISNALPPQSVAPGSGGIALSRAINASRDTAKAGVDAAYDAARALEPESALVRSDVMRSISDDVRNALSDFDLRDVPSVDRALEALLSPTLRGQRSFADLPSVRSLFEVRSRLSTLSANGNPMEQAAAGRARRALDAQIDRISDEGLIEGNAEAVTAWRDANRLRRDFGSRFEGGDLLDRIGSREYRGGSMQQAVAPEDVSNLIMGQGRGVSSRANAARDLGRISELFPDAMGDVRREAGSRLMRMQGENVAPGYDDLMRQNPTLARILVDSDTRSAIERARQAVSGAQAERATVNTAQRVLTDTPDRFATAPSGSVLRESTIDSLVNSIGSTPLPALRQMARNPNTRANLAYSLGEDASRVSGASEALLRRGENAAFLDAASGSKTAPAALDAAGAASFITNLVTGGKSAVLDFIRKAASGVTLSPADREAIMRLGVSEADVLRAAADPNISQYLVAPASAGASQLPATATW